MCYPGNSQVLTQTTRFRDLSTAMRELYSKIEAASPEQRLIFCWWNWVERIEKSMRSAASEYYEQQLGEYYLEDIERYLEIIRQIISGFPNIDEVAAPPATHNLEEKCYYGCKISEELYKRYLEFTLSKGGVTPARREQYKEQAFDCVLLSFDIVASVEKAKEGADSTLTMVKRRIREAVGRQEGYQISDFGDEINFFFVGEGKETRSLLAAQAIFFALLEVSVLSGDAKDLIQARVAVVGGYAKNEANNFECIELVFLRDLLSDVRMSREGCILADQDTIAAAMAAGYGSSYFVPWGPYSSSGVEKKLHITDAPTRTTPGAKFVGKNGALASRKWNRFYTTAEQAPGILLFSKENGNEPLVLEVEIRDFGLGGVLSVANAPKKHSVDIPEVGDSVSLQLSANILPGKIVAINKKSENRTNKNTKFWIHVVFDNPLDSSWFDEAFGGTLAQ